MKRLRTLILLSCILISGCAEEYTEMDIISSHSITADNWYELDISVIVDETTALDRDACSEEIVQHILDNDFHSTRFSFDLSGYPNEVSVDVFTSEKMFKKIKKPILSDMLQHSIQKTWIYKIISKIILRNLKYNTNPEYISFIPFDQRFTIENDIITHDIAIKLMEKYHQS